MKSAIDVELHQEGLQYFFAPRSIAIIGASADLTKPSGRPIAALLKKGYKGHIYPINPRYREIAGLSCYPSVADSRVRLTSPLSLLPGRAPSAYSSSVLQRRRRHAAIVRPRALP